MSRHIKLGGTTCRYTPEKCEEFAPLINAINQLKHEKNAIVLAHSYVSPEIQYGVADFVGDSYELSRNAASTTARVIVFAAVKFMAETAKILNPEKEVYIPSSLNGCTLADSITALDVKNLRKQYPDYTFVCYINTSAEVKAECDVCVTSSNVYKIVEAISNPNIYFLPDRLMGKNLINELQKKGVAKTIRLWDGTCYVHEAYNPDSIEYLRMEYPDLRVLSHPECGPSVLHASDFVGSTSQMIRYVHESNANAYFLLTECGLSSRLQMELPHKKFVGTCTMCKFMKSNTLQDIYRVLQHPTPTDRVEISPSLIQKARLSIDRMFYFAEKKSPLRSLTSQK